MDKVCKKIIEKMHNDGPPEQFAYWLFPDALKYNAEQCGLTAEEFSNAVNQLVAEGWAEFVYTRYGNRSGVKLTHKGVHYKEYLRSEKTKSILLPAAVSIITTLTTSALKELWPLLSQWFSSFPK